MSEQVYTCMLCGVKSTPENRISFATEYECYWCWYGFDADGVKIPFPLSWYLSQLGDA